MANPEVQLADALEGLEDDFLVVVTGAGISAASGIPTFRGAEPDAIWKRDPVELATYRYFREDPVGSWRWFMSRFATLVGARPNPAHVALTAIERWQLERGGRYLLVTQNIDTLHEQAGAREMVKVHGTSDRARCPRTGCRHGAPRGSLPRDAFSMDPFVAEPSLDTLPRCPECGDVLRPHVLWFDEYYDQHQDYQWSRVQDAAYGMSFVLFVGTSFSVGVTDMFLRGALGAGVPACSIDPAGVALPYSGVEVLAAKAEELLPAACERLGLGVDSAPEP